jgi:hypothetical protein
VADYRLLPTTINDTKKTQSINHDKEIGILAQTEETPFIYFQF